MPTEKKKPKPRPPKGMAPGGRALWNAVLAIYELRPDETRVLREACAEVDLIDALDAQRRKLPVLVTGSQGQQVMNPVISELRQHRTVLAGLLRQLRLPEESSPAADVPQTRATRARAAANSRWTTDGA